MALMLIVAMMAGACAESKLKEAVAEMNSKCPYEINEQMSVASVELKDSMIVFRMESGNKAAVEQMKNAPQLSKLTVQMMMAGIKKENENLVKLMADAHAGMRLVLASKSGDVEMEADYSPEEVEKLLDSEVNPKEFVVVMIVETMNSILPMDTGNGVRQLPLILDENQLVFSFEVDEKSSMWKDLKKERSTLKQEFMTILQTNPESFGGKQFLDGVASSGRKLVFKYIGSTSGETISAELENADLKTFIH
jgi:hypothetical protein